MSKVKEYVPYVYKCKEVITIDARTGCASAFNPRSKHNK